jgi:hypothetical protein
MFKIEHKQRLHLCFAGGKFHLSGFVGERRNGVS